MSAGRFISIEGGEGAGKSTQIIALACALREKGLDVIVTREPGGTEGAETIRQLLLSGSSGRWQPRAEALLFAAARSDHVERLIRPTLALGTWIVSDRFLESSRAYQVAGSGLKDSDILALHMIGSQDLLPDRTFVLELPEAQAAARVKIRDGEINDRIGARDAEFHSMVHQNFRHFARTDPNRIRMIDAGGEPFEVTQRLLAGIEDLLL